MSMLPVCCYPLKKAQLLQEAHAGISMQTWQVQVPDALCILGPNNDWSAQCRCISRTIISISITLHDMAACGGHL